MGVSDALARIENADSLGLEGGKRMRAMAEVLYRFMAKDSVATADGRQGSPQMQINDWSAFGGCKVR